MAQTRLPPIMAQTRLPPQAQSPYASPSFNTLPPGTMGPPSRPVEKSTDASELTDVLASSGIDVREEEAFLTHRFSGPTAQAQPTREDSEAARRAQHHLQDPFLLSKILEQKIQKRAFDLGVRIPPEGVFHPVGRPQAIEVTGPDGSSVVRTGQTIINQNGAPLVDILNLISISCEERLRGTVDYASILARSRRAHADGVVPTEWVDVAETSNLATDNIATPSKRPHPGNSEPGQEPPSKKYRGSVNKDTAFERKIAARRAKRSAEATLSEVNGMRSDSFDYTGSAPSTPIADRAPSFDRKSVTKKEARKMVDTKASEAQQHQQSVETARMATNSMLSGRMFGTKKTYSWLIPGGASPSGFSSPSRPSPSTPTAIPTEKMNRSGQAAPNQPKLSIGSWREDGASGAGIQVRDLLFTLEGDGRGIKHVQRACLKDPKEAK